MEGITGDLMAWYYNSDSGAVQEQPEWIAYPQLHLGLSWHGPFKSKQDALNYYEAGKAANPGWKAPTGVAGNISNLATGTGSAIADATKSAIGDVTGQFNLAAWFVRIGEILLGLILIGVGVSKMTGVGNVITKAVKAAK